jgi:[CysO sulfur-carrier protein]-S-L-cysteine hydrolase
MSLENKLQLPIRLHDEMLAQAFEELPNECCGLLAGRDGRVTHRYPLSNALTSPVRYESDPKAMFAAFKDMRQQGTDLLAIYHSHPTSEPVPSRTDLERNLYGMEVVHFIISLQGGVPQVRAWRLAESSYEPAEWIILPAGCTPV